MVNTYSFPYADGCLNLLCSKSEMISKVLEWISSDDLPLDLRASAALIAANIARNGMLIYLYISITNQLADSAIKGVTKVEMVVPKCL